MKTMKPYLGSYHGEKSARGRQAFVVGAAFGPMLLTVGADMEEAVSEFDERFGERVGAFAEDSALRDYGDDAETALEAAINAGDVRINDGGTTVWVDAYEWFREFRNASEALAWMRGR